MSDTISRQSAINGLRDYLVGKRCPDDGTLTCRLIENEVINKLPPIQPVNCSEFPNNSDTISRQAAIDAIKGIVNDNRSISICDAIKQLPPAHEPLTDKEQRIFLAAIERERKVCKEVDDQYTHEPYEVLLTKVCSEIKRKVKKALWS